MRLIHNKEEEEAEEETYMCCGYFTFIYKFT